MSARELDEWYALGADELRHDHLRDVRLLRTGRRFAVEIFDREFVHPARTIPSSTGQPVALSAARSPRWTRVGDAPTPRAAYTIAVGALLAYDMAYDARRELLARERASQRSGRPHRSSHRIDARDLRRRLADPGRVVTALGLGQGARRQSGDGLMIRCPAPDHDDRTPSCSVRVGRDGTLAIRCHGCGWTGDVLGLIAVVDRLSVQHDFPRILARAADLAGTWGPFTRGAP